MNIQCTNRTRLFTLVLWMMAGPVHAIGIIDTRPAEWVDTSHWKCKYCVVDEGWSGEAELGAGHVSDPSAKFGEYNGLDEDGGHLIGNAQARYRNGDGRYLDLRIRDLGLDTREVKIEGGRQGRYGLFLDYNEIPHAVSDSAQTPYLGNGSDNLTMPAGWVTAGSTAGMTSLVGSLKDIDLYTQRKRVAAGLSFLPTSRWATTASFRHEERDGNKRSAGTFFFNSAQLVEPIDYVTDEVELAVSRNTPKWQTKLAYYGSFFSNQNNSLTWQNAYNPLAAGADNGQRALAPDNRFHQVLFSTGYRVSESTRINGDIAFGRMEQDEALLAATLNPNFSVSLPRSSADAKVNTTTANVKFDRIVNTRIRVNASYRYNDRDNKTPIDTFNQVITDTYAGVARRNLPYSFTDHTAKLDGSYRFSNRTQFSGGYEYDQKHRTYQEVENAQEHTVWAKVATHFLDLNNLSLRYAHAIRDIDGYNPVAETVPPENPLLRKYNLADRVRDTASISGGFSPHERIAIELGGDLALDDYTDSVLGLQQSNEYGLNADATVIWTDRTTLHAFLGWQRIDSEQAGSHVAAVAPEWIARNEDTIESFGFGIKHTFIENRLDAGIDYTLLQSTAKVNSNTYVADGQFPDLKTDLDTLKLYADYTLKEDMKLHAAYWYERYDSSDWMLDGVGAATIPNLLSFGESTPSYNQHVLMLSLRYSF